MNAGRPDPEPSVPLSPAVFHILLSLTEGEKHGYAIMQDVATTTNGQLRMGPGTLYGSVKRMLAAGLIDESDDRPDPALDDERRRYYRLTEIGQRMVTAEAQRMAKLVAVARKRGLTLTPKPA